MGRDAPLVSHDKAAKVPGEMPLDADAELLELLLQLHRCPDRPQWRTRELAVARDNQQKGTHQVIRTYIQLVLLNNALLFTEEVSATAFQQDRRWPEVYCGGIAGCPQPRIFEGVVGYLRKLFPLSIGGRGL